MRRLCIILITLCVCQDAAYTQVNPSDSIATILASLPNDSARIAKCLEEARSSDPEISAIYIAKGKAIASRLRDTLAEARFMTEEAIQANIAGQHIEGARMFMRVDSIYRVMGDSALRAGALTNAGLSYYHASAYDSALTKYFDAYRIYAHMAPSTGYSRLLNNLAMCFKRTEKPDEAKRYYRESINIKKVLDDSLGIANTMHNLGLLYGEHDVDHAVGAFDTALSIYRTLDMQDDQASTNVAMGKVLMDAGQFERSIPFLQSGYVYFKRSAPESEEFLLSAGDMASLSGHLEQWDKALHYVDEALNVTSHADKMEDRAMLLQRKADILTHLGKNGEAYRTLQQFVGLHDTLNSRQRVSLIEEMQTRFFVRDKENALALTQLELENKGRVARLYRTGMFVAILILTVIGILVIFLFKSRREIQRNQKIIEAALHEKGVLLREIHHRVKNNLQVISSLLGMQSYQSTDPNVSSAMREGQSRVRAMALIHQNLYQDSHAIYVDSREYINSLLDSLKSAYRTKVGNVDVHTDVDALKLDVDLMIPIGLILNELVSNAFKYAFPDHRDGNINVSLKQSRNAYALVVQDDGAGLPETRTGEQVHSMGYTLVRDFCAKLKATLQISSEQGTHIQITIPQQANAT